MLSRFLSCYRISDMLTLQSQACNPVVASWLDVILLRSSPLSCSDLLLILTSILITTLLLLLRSLGLLPPDTTWPSSTEGARQREIDMFLAVQANNKRRHVDDLLPDADVTLLDQDAGVVDGFRETELVHAGLQAALQEVVNVEGEHVVELHAGFVEDTDADETADQGVSFEEAFGVFLIEGQ
jgi:hypothetical protein